MAAGEHKQLLHLVFGGELVDLDGTEFRDLSAIDVVGLSTARWADPANPLGWSAPWTVLLPVPVPLASVATAAQ